MDTTLSDPLVGRSLEGRYVIEAFIAHGGMASVYLATDTRLDRRVAVKVLHAHLSDDKETRARFEREARAAARLSNPDVVAVYDQGIDNNRPFLVMEFVPGANLRHIIRDRGRLTPGEALTVMDHVLAALASAHAAGLVHRDVKPENVLVTADGRVKVADFGLARAVSGSTVTTTGSVLMGTAAYLAPEQFEHGTADERSDVYSAGVMLFELLTGSTPFTADSAYALLSKHANEDIPAPSTRASDIPPQLDALVTWATSRDPQERPADAGEFHASLIDVRNRLNLHGAVPTPPIALTARVPDPPQQTTVMPQTSVMPAPGAGVTRVVGGGRPPAAPARVATATPNPRKRGRRRGLIVAAILTVVVVLAAVAGWWFAAGRYTNAPTVTGLSKTQAIAKLKSAGYHARFLGPIYTTTTPKDEVAAETHNSHVTKGATVDLRMSLGGRPYTLPNYASESVDSATADLAAHDIGISKTSNVHSLDVTKGLVVGTKPAEGATVTAGNKVILQVSLGPPHVAVPSVAGKSEGDATTALQAKGFQVGESIDRYDNTVPSGNVIRTHPHEGRKIVKGSTVTLVVSKGPRLFEVPNVNNEPIGQAVRDIKDAGFIPDPKQFAPGGDGTVFRETPQGPQPHGATIELDWF